MQPSLLITAFIASTIHSATIDRLLLAAVLNVCLISPNRLEVLRTGTTFNIAIVSAQSVHGNYSIKSERVKLSTLV